MLFSKQTNQIPCFGFFVVVVFLFLWVGWWFTYLPAAHVSMPLSSHLWSVSVISNNVRGVLLERETLLCVLLIWYWLTSAALLASCFTIVQTLGWSMDVWAGVAAKDVGRQCCLSVTSWCFLYALLCTTLYMQTYPQFMEVDYTQTCLVAFQFFWVVCWNV